MPEMDRSQPLEIIKNSEDTYIIMDNGVRCFLMIGSERAMLVDTGFGQAGSLRAAVESLTDKPVMLVNTHGDNDHIGHNAEFDVTYMHPSEMAYYSKNAKPGITTVPLWEGDVIDLGGLSLEVILIPGHTPGSIALLNRKDRYIVSGDSLSAGPVFMIGDGSNLLAYQASMEKLLRMGNVFDAIYPAHGPLPLGPEYVNKALTAVKKLINGELSPEESTMPIPGKMYMYDGAGFFY